MLLTSGKFSYNVKSSTFEETCREQISWARAKRKEWQGNEGWMIWKQFVALGCAGSN